MTTMNTPMCENRTPDALASTSTEPSVPNDLSGLTLVSGPPASGKTRLLHAIASSETGGSVVAFLPKLGAEYEKWPDIASRTGIHVWTPDDLPENTVAVYHDVVTGLLRRAHSGDLIIIDEAWTISTQCYAAVLDAIERGVRVVMSSTRRSDFDLYAAIASRQIICERV